MVGGETALVQAAAEGGGYRPCSDSNVDDRLEEHRVLAKRCRLDERAVRGLDFGRSRFEDNAVHVGALDAPYGSTAPHQDSDWKLLVCPANLDLAVGKPQSQDRLWGDAFFIGHDLPTLPTTACLGASGIPPIGYWFDSHDEGLIACLAHDPPQLSSTAERFTDVRRGLLREGVHLKVAVWVTDLEQAARHGSRVPEEGNVETSSLDESLSAAQLVLLKQNASELRQSFRADIVERPEDALAIFDGECDDVAIERERLLEKGTRRLVHKRDELANVLVRNPQTGEVHGGELTREPTDYNASRWDAVPGGRT